MFRFINIFFEKNFLRDIDIIYTVMVVSRAPDTPSIAHTHIKDMLDWGHITLIVPEIVIIETLRRIPILIDGIGNELKQMIETLEKSYWINVEAKDKKYKEMTKSAISSFREYREILNNNKDDYIRGSLIRVNKLFDHENSIKIETEEKLLSQVLKRKIYKKCPFHRNDPSYQDALIIETLIKIKEYLSINENDQIFFITKNYRDFSEGKDKRGVFTHTLSKILNLLDWRK